MPNPIDFEKIPGADIQPDAIEENARTIGTISGQVSEHGSNVNFTWQGMAGVYEAPESPTLLGLMAPVSSQATQVGDNLAEVSAALIAFAADVRPIKAELDSLRIEAKAFVDSIQGGVQVREINPAWTAAQSPYGGATATPTYQGSWGGSTTTAAPATPDKYRTVTKEWHESQEHVDRNNELLAAVNAQQIRLWEAERACANRIRALYGADALRAAQSENDSLGYGIAEIPEGTEMPWGADVERTEGCAEAAATFVVKDFLWEGIVVGGIWGTVEGLGTLILGYNPATGEFFSTDAYGAAWGNLGTLAGGLLMNVMPPLSLLVAADDAAQMFGGQVLPQELRDFKDSSREAWLNTGKALIAWDKWADDPGTAAGEAVFNVATILIPAGAAVTGVKTASTAASVVAKAARVVDFVDPGALAMNGALRLGGAGIGGLDNIIGRLGSNTSDGLHLHTPDMPLVADDAASALRALDEAGIDLNSITARIDEGVPVYEFPPTDAIPSGRIEMPAGSFDGIRGGDLPARTDVSGRSDGGADAGVAAPVREPELVAAGGVRGETGPGAVNSIVEDAPVRTETGGAGESTIVCDPSTETGGGSSHAGGEGGSATGAGGHGGSDTGDGGNDAGRGDGGADAGRRDDGIDVGRGDHGEGFGGDAAKGSPHVPPHTGLDAPPPHTGADAPPLPLEKLAVINDEFRLASGEVDPARMDKWAAAVSEAYPALTPEQVKAIYWYTTDEGYEAMNPYLRDDGDAPMDPLLERRISDLTQGLANLPAEATPGRFFSRGVIMRPDFLDQFRPGQKWSDPSFTSVTSDPAVAQDFAERALLNGDSPGIITVDGVTPSAISPLSRYAYESELLHQRGTIFEVLSKYQDGTGTWHVHMREVRE